MPWEKSFDTDDALDAAMHVFWAKGYEETSMSDLTHAMGINKGSLYNAYGDKHALFVAALRKYDNEHRTQCFAQLDDIDDPVQAINALFDDLISQSAGDVESKGCMLVNTSLKLPYHDAEVQDIIKHSLGEIEKFFQRQIKKINAKKAGTVPQVKDTAKSLLALVVGLQVLARGTFDKAGLNTIKRQAITLIS